MSLQTRLAHCGTIALCLIALAGCDQPVASGAGSPASPSASVVTKDAKAEAFAKSEAAAKKMTELPHDRLWEGDFLDPEFAKKENENNAAFEVNRKRLGFQIVRKTYRIDKIKAFHYQSSPLATTVLVCSTSNQRLIDKDGNDITRDQHNQPVPDKDLEYASHFSLDSKDGGATWQITGTSEASVEECSAS